MKLICKIPVPDGSLCISSSRIDNEWMLLYECPNSKIRVFLFNLETHKLFEIEDANELWHRS